LVNDTVRLCFGLQEVPPGKSIEDLFSDAEDRNDSAPILRLAEFLRKADYYIAARLACESDYGRFFETFKESVFLTFNYDSLPEIILFRQGSWYPHDGYGVPVAVDLPPGAEEFANKKSTARVLHLHGTLCIRTSESEIRREPGQTMARLHMCDRPLFAFDASSISGCFSPIGRVVGRDDVAERVIAPIPNKARGLNGAFVRTVYDQAQTALVTCDTVIAIGYSFNQHDRASYAPILHTLETSAKRLMIVAPDAMSITRRLRIEFPGLQIEPISLTFKEWAAATF
jgi:hypothetical protein